MAPSVQLRQKASHAIASKNFGAKLNHHTAQLPADEIRAAAAKWFATHGRDLPWRRTNDVYAILVSEMMLQQTTVAAVIPYFEKFLRLFPSVNDLAVADEQSVLAAWSGLGYYRRAKLLHAAAKTVAGSSPANFPSSVEDLARLPGIGRYTAGAIASFAFDLPAPIVEANTARLLARICAERDPLSSTHASTRLWSLAADLLPLGTSGGRVHNSALMDLGAKVCTITAPNCKDCPLNRWCLSRKFNLQTQIPAPRLRPEKLQRAFAAAVIRNSDNLYLISQIPAGQWHAGLWCFPQIEVSPAAAPSAHMRSLRQHLNPHLAPETKLRPLTTLNYTVTRHAVTLHVYHARISSIADHPAPRNQLPGATTQWLSLREIAELPLGSAQRRLLRQLQNAPSHPPSPSRRHCHQ